ncbi:hypothetical protein [Lactococcus protaetiae]|uniref:Uncharacterized protein n=1 Tax=Lactococcus protaetiae TaxID=2592653 RepID=A0A514Z8T4_9LACT|nr:hypothetical protein [Lactococcus protaetiae]QDK70998.1 hypothetical protein FLP15_07280 [Lactococcus protaetiae]
MSNNYQARTRKKRMTPLLILTGLIAILFAAGGFAGGYFVGQHHANSKTSANFTKGQGQTGGFAGDRKNGDMGTVSTISSSSVTIKTRSGSSETFTINSSTSVQEAQMGQGPNQGGTTSSSSSDDSSSSASLSDVTTGSNVVIIPTSSTSKTAKTIMLMPSGMGNNDNSTAGNS